MASLTAPLEARLLRELDRRVPRSGARLAPPLEIVGAWFAGEPHAVIGAAAAEHHGLTYDTPSTIEIQLARDKR